jgi:hypothetical protein
MGLDGRTGRYVRRTDRRTNRTERRIDRRTRAIAKPQHLKPHPRFHLGVGGHLGLCGMISGQSVPSKPFGEMVAPVEAREISGRNLNSAKACGFQTAQRGPAVRRRSSGRLLRGRTAERDASNPSIGFSGIKINATHTGPQAARSLPCREDVASPGQAPDINIRHELGGVDDRCCKLRLAKLSPAYRHILPRLLSERWTAGDAPAVSAVHDQRVA